VTTWPEISYGKKKYMVQYTLVNWFSCSSWWQWHGHDTGGKQANLASQYNVYLALVRHWNLANQDRIWEILPFYLCSSLHSPSLGTATERQKQLHTWSSSPSPLV
jgi:hypothetical protein